MVLKIPERRIHVIPNGVDTDWFIRNHIKKTDDSRLIVGTVGNLMLVKNHALLIQACAILNSQEIGIELLITGDGSEKRKLERLAASLNLRRNLRLLGDVDDVPKFLQGLDVFVLHSASEAHPNALLEAMLVESPCVATGVGGVKEVLDDSKLGIAVEPGNKSELASTIAES